jgi:Tol biopolymer transport system component
MASFALRAQNEAIMQRAKDFMCAGLGVLSCGLARGQSTARVSVDSSGAQADLTSWFGTISAEGRFVAFSSDATNLVSGDTNGCTDVFVRDRQAGTTERVSVDSNEAQGNGSNTFGEAISAFGRYVVFVSDGTNLVPGDANGVQDVFVRDRQAGTTERVSLGSGGVQANGPSRDGAISADGRFVAFTSDASNLVPGDSNGCSDVFVRDRVANTTQRISVNTSGVQGDSWSSGPSISASGRLVAFESLATNFAPTDVVPYEIFVRDREAGTTQRVSGSGAGDVSDSLACRISAEGRFVVFEQFDAGGPSRCDILVHDAETAAIYPLSSGSGFSTSPSISADGRYVVFQSDNFWLVPGDTNGVVDVFLHDLQMNTVARVSLDSAGAQGNLPSAAPLISADGRCVVFRSAATNLVPGDSNGTWDVFVRALAPEVAVPFCFGDGAATPCPCGYNIGRLFRGCQNSDFTDGAYLAAEGSSSLANDTLRITSTGGKGQALSTFLQGDARIAAQNFGDGLRCIGGNLKRLYARNAFGGVVSAPEGTEPSISSRSAARSDPIPVGATRYYQVMYRDPAPWHCPDPPGNTWNVGTALSVIWNP